MAHVRLRRSMYLAVGVSTLGLVLWTAFPPPSPPVSADAVLWGFLAVAVLYALVETWPLVFEVRGETPVFTLTGVPLVVGLVFLGPVPTMLARVVGTGLVQGLWWRINPLKWAVNIAGVVVEVWIAGWVLGSIGGAEFAHFSLRGWIAVGAAGLVADLSSGLVVMVAMRLTAGPLGPGSLRSFAIGSAVNSGVGTPLAILAVLTVAVDIRATLVLAPVALLLVTTNRARHHLSQRYSTVQQLYRFITDLSGSRTTKEVIDLVLRRAEQATGATRSQLILVGRTDATSWSHHGDHLVGEEVDLLAATTLMHAAYGGMLLGPGDTVDPIMQPLLPEGYEQVLVGRFANAELTGALVLADRAGTLALFDEDDVQMIVALAGHAGSAVGESRLLDRVQAEAARRELMALTDRTTGLKNRAGLIDSMPRMERGVVFVIGVRDINEISTGFGHSVAERVATSVAQRLTASSQSRGGEVARLRMGQFAVCIPRTLDDAETSDVANSLVRDASGAVEHGGLRINVAVRVGVAHAPVHGVEIVELVRAAERGLSEAAETRRTSGEFDSERDRETKHRLELASELRTAIDESHLRVAYQPKVDLASGRVTGVEALCRWPHAQRGYISPAEFIDVAERTGLIQPLTLWVTERSLDQCLRWRAEGLELSVAINLSNAALLDPDAAREIVAMIDAHELPNTSVVLEITETQLMEDVQLGGAALSVFDAAGVELSIDDFGTGYSSLAHLKDIPVREMKIDRAFVAEAGRDQTQQVMCQAMITMAHQLGLRVVAEGVADAECADVLRGLGCDVAQGFYYATPVPAPQIRTTIAEIEAITVDGTLRRLGQRGLRGN